MHGLLGNQLDDTYLLCMFRSRLQTAGATLRRVTTGPVTGVVPLCALKSVASVMYSDHNAA